MWDLYGKTRYWNSKSFNLCETIEIQENILIALENEKFKIPSEIANEVGTITSHVSCHLSGLKEKGLIKCINEDAKKGRLYYITEKGKSVLKHITKEWRNKF